MKLFIIVALAITGSLAQSSTNWCDTSLCQFYTGAGYETRPHIACTGVAQNGCPADAAAIPMDSTMQQFILSKHNTYRNSLAGGSVNKFATASKMPEMTWDADLAYIAAKNAMQCVYGHDKCRNTKTYLYAGQNIGKGTGASDNKAFITSIIDMWWGEYSQCTQSTLDKYGSTSAMIGHFTAMSADRSNKIGCAGVTYSGSTRIFVCNYGYTNMMGEPIYVKGTTASGCKSGKSKTYPNLCSASEVVKPVPIGMKRTIE